jgi:hypothetical protein
VQIVGRNVSRNSNMGVQYEDWKVALKLMLKMAVCAVNLTRLGYEIRVNVCEGGYKLSGLIIIIIIIII